MAGTVGSSGRWGKVGGQGSLVGLLNSEHTQIENGRFYKRSPASKNAGGATRASLFGKSHCKFDLGIDGRILSMDPWIYLYSSESLWKAYLNDMKCRLMRFLNLYSIRSDLRETSPRNKPAKQAKNNCRKATKPALDILLSTLPSHLNRWGAMTWAALLGRPLSLNYSEATRPPFGLFIRSFMFVYLQWCSLDPWVDTLALVHKKRLDLLKSG